MIALIDRLPPHGADAQTALREELYGLTSSKPYGPVLFEGALWQTTL